MWKNVQPCGTACNTENKIKYDFLHTAPPWSIRFSIFHKFVKSFSFLFFVFLVSHTYPIPIHNHNNITKAYFPIKLTDCSKAIILNSHGSCMCQHKNIL